MDNPQQVWKQTQGLCNQIAQLLRSQAQAWENLGSAPQHNEAVMDQGLLDNLKGLHSEYRRDAAYVGTITGIVTGNYVGGGQRSGGHQKGFDQTLQDSLTFSSSGISK